MFRHWSSAIGLLVLIHKIRAASLGESNNAPNCTGEQLAAARASYECVTLQYGAPFEEGGSEGSGTCPEDCCCDFQATSTGTIRRFSRVDACAMEAILDSSNAVAQAFVRPYTVDSGLNGSMSRACDRKIAGKCGELIGKGGCAFDISMVLPAQAVAENDRRRKRNEEAQSKTDEEKDREGDEREKTINSSSTNGKSQEKDKKSRRGKLCKNSIIALSVCVTFLCTSLLFAIASFIIRPLLKSDTEDVAISKSISDGPGFSNHSMGGKPTEIDEELMKLDAKRVLDGHDSTCGNAEIRTVEPATLGQQDPFVDLSDSAAGD